MNCVVNKHKLQSALQKVTALVPKTKSDKLYNVVRIDALEDKLVITASHGEVYFETVIEAGVTDAGVVTLYGRNLLDIVSNCESQVTLLSNDSRCVIGSENYKWSEPLLTYNIERKTFDTTNICSVDQLQFLWAFATARYAIDGDSVRPSYYMLDVLDGRFRACNGHQYHESRLDIPNFTFSVNANYIDGFSMLLKHFDGTVVLSDSPNHHVFSCGPDLVCLKKQSLKFPDLDLMLVKPLRRQTPALLKLEKITLVKALKKLLVGYDDDYPYVEMHITNDNVVFRASRGYGKSTVVEHPASWDSSPRVATFKLKALLSTIENAEELDLEVRFGPDTKQRKSPMVIEGSNSWAMINQVNLRT